jgi:hypothetical protein
VSNVFIEIGHENPWESPAFGRKCNPWFKRGSMFRHALDALRKAPRPMTVRQITDAVMANNRITEATKKQRADLEAGVRSCLERNVVRTVERAGEGVPRLWRLAI